jgi:hypothetical protein
MYGARENTFRENALGVRWKSLWRCAFGSIDVSNGRSSTRVGSIYDHR